MDQLSIERLRPIIIFMYFFRYGKLNVMTEWEKKCFHQFQVQQRDLICSTLLYDG